MNEDMNPQFPYHERVKGWRMPAHEVHLANWMTKNPKKKHIREIDGRMTYQYSKYEEVMKYVKDRGLALDIGAHVGFWAWYMCRDFEHVTCFEPAPPHIEMLKWNLRDRENWSLCEYALGDEPGSLMLDIPITQSGNAHIRCEGVHPGNRYGNVDEFEEYQVPVRKLDDVLDAESKGRVDMIKIDVEGYEYPALKGGETVIRASLPVIIVEQKGCDVAYGYSFKEGKEYLESLGYVEMSNVSNDYVMVHPDG